MNLFFKKKSGPERPEAVIVLTQREHLEACLARTRLRAFLLGLIAVFIGGVGMFLLGMKLGMDAERVSFKKQCSALMNEYCPARIKDAKELQQRLLKSEKKGERKNSKNKSKVK